MGQSIWSRVTYTDESSFAVCPSNQYIRVWQRKGERYIQQCNAPTFKSKYKLRSVWGSLSARGRTPLAGIRGSFNQQVYKDIIDTTLILFVEEIMVEFILQKNKCGLHRANSIALWLSYKKINPMEWSAQSADLNPIENVCGVLKQKLRKLRKFPKNEVEVFEIVSKLWNNLPDAYFQKLHVSMSIRVQKFKTVKGRSTKY